MPTNGIKNPKQKRSAGGKLLISVVISVLNGEKTLAACFDSVLMQDYESLEILVIDGGSKDSTLEILNRYSDRIDYSISEPDTGVYNAWNKAVRIAKGEWVCFLGCDDTFSSTDSLSELARYALYPKVNYVSGRSQLVNSSGRRSQAEGKPFNATELGDGMKFSHPGSLHHSSLFRENGLFNEQFKIAGDYEFFIRCSRSIRPAFTPLTIVLMGDGGMSNTQQLRVFLESYRALRNSIDFGSIVGAMFLLISIIKSIAREIIYVKIPFVYIAFSTIFKKIQRRLWF
jgi:glycosyltransferase involved in cell wall biosynthesis